MPSLVSNMTGKDEQHDMERTVDYRYRAAVASEPHNFRFWQHGFWSCFTFHIVLSLPRLGQTPAT